MALNPREQKLLITLLKGLREEELRLSAVCGAIGVADDFDNSIDVYDILNALGVEHNDGTTEPIFDYISGRANLVDAIRFYNDYDDAITENEYIEAHKRYLKAVHPNE